MSFNMAAQKFTLSEKAELSVDCGIYGLFVVVKKNTSSILLSKATWKLLGANKEIISAHVANNKEFSLLFNDKKRVKTVLYNHFIMVCFEEAKTIEGEEKTVHINLTGMEWGNLTQKFVEVCRMLDRYVAYRDNDNKWTLVMPQEYIDRLFLDPPPTRCVELALTAFMLENEICDIAKRRCSACKRGNVHLLEHELGCGRTYDELVDDYFDHAYASTGMSRAFGILSQFMKRHFYPIHDHASKKEVKECVKDPSTVKCTFPNFAQTMHNTFQSLRLFEQAD